MQLIKCYRVSGKVQGVFFRSSTARRATELNLSGTVLNRADGTVEVIAAGEPVALETLHQWLHEGPELATVDKVEELPCDERMRNALPTAGFSVLRI